MDIREQLLVELSHFNMHYIADVLGTDPLHFRSIMEMILYDKDPVPPRAAWVAELMSQKDPELIKPWVGKIVQNLEKFTHPGTRRNTLKIFMRTEIPEEHQGMLIDICFRWVMDEDKKVASKIFAMQIIENHIPLYPDLSVELSEVINDQWDKNSAGFKSRGRKVLKNIQKHSNSSGF